MKQKKLFNVPIKDVISVNVLDCFIFTIKIFFFQLARYGVFMGNLVPMAVLRPPRRYQNFVQISYDRIHHPGACLLNLEVPF